MIQANSFILLNVTSGPPGGDLSLTGRFTAEAVNRRARTAPTTRARCSLGAGHSGQAISRIRESSHQPEEAGSTASSLSDKVAGSWFLETTDTHSWTTKGERGKYEQKGSGKQGNTNTRCHVAPGPSKEIPWK